MDCSPAMNIRNAKGHMRHTATTTTERKALSPISQNGAASTRPSCSTRMWLMTPVSRWSMKFQVITAAYSGSA